MLVDLSLAGGDILSCDGSRLVRGVDVFAGQPR